MAVFALIRLGGELYRGRSGRYRGPADMPRALPRSGGLTRRNRHTRSSGRSRHPLKRNKPARVVAEVHHADLEPRPRLSDGAHDRAAHPHHLIAEHMLDARTHLRACPVCILLGFIEGVVAPRPEVNAAVEAPGVEPCLGRFRTIGAVGPRRGWCLRHRADRRASGCRAPTPSSRPTCE
jgi:hypothetical protein